jgi:hypothetical protein
MNRECLNKKGNGVVLAAAWLALLAACSSSSTSSGGTNNSTCAAACRTMGTCFAAEASGKVRTIDQRGCEEQCAKELKGEGFLSKDYATRIFAQLSQADARGGDPQCVLEAGFRQFSDGQYKNVGDPAFMDRCVATRLRACPNTVESVHRGDCFVRRYRFNDAIRAEYAKCDVAVECRALTQCESLAQSKVAPICEPWFGPSGADCQ